MNKVLLEAGLSIDLIVFLLIAIPSIGWTLKQVLLLIADSRKKLAEEIRSRKLKRIDEQLEKFYLPLRERFLFSKSLNDTTLTWEEDGRIVNKSLQIKSEDINALRNIVFRRMLLPINKEACRIIIDGQHQKRSDDPVNYNRILEHLVIWDALEESLKDGEIEYYNATQILQFPGAEVEKFHKYCEKILVKRSQIETNSRGY